MAEITRFYDVLLSRSEAILDHVETFPLDAMPAPTLRLFRLQLALAHAAMSVELHKQPRAHNSPYPHQVRILWTAEPTLYRSSSHERDDRACQHLHQRSDANRRTGHRSSLLRALSFTRLFRARTRKSVQARLADRGPGGTDSRKGQLLHQDHRDLERADRGDARQR